MNTDRPSDNGLGKTYLQVCWGEAHSVISLSQFSSKFILGCAGTAGLCRGAQGKTLVMYFPTGQHPFKVGQDRK